MLIPFYRGKPKPEKETVRLRLWSKDAFLDALEGEEVKKDFYAFERWLESQTRPGQLEVFIGSTWGFVGFGGEAFHWDGARLSRAPGELLYPIIKESGLGLEDSVVHGVMLYEAWKIIKRHHDFFYTGISAFAGKTIDEGKSDS